MASRGTSWTEIMSKIPENKPEPMLFQYTSVSLVQINIDF